MILCVCVLEESQHPVPQSRKILDALEHEAHMSQQSPKHSLLK